MSEHEPSLTIDDALEILSDGHTVFLEPIAERVCVVVNVPFDEKLVIHWSSKADAFRRFGFTAESDGPGSGVRGLDLSYHVASELGLGRPGAPFFGRGFQAQANGRAIAQLLASKGEASS